MKKMLVFALRAVLVVIALGTAVAQVLVAIAAAELANQYPEYASVAVPYTIAAILAVGCGQAALVFVWRLLSLIASGTVFTERARRWVDGIVVAFAAATIITAAVTFHVLVIASTGGPALALALMGSIVLGVALVLLMMVMRGLLSTATTYRSELDEVI